MPTITAALTYALGPSWERRHQNDHSGPYHHNSRRYNYHHGHTASVGGHEPRSARTMNPDDAARLIQKIALRKLISDDTALERKQLMDRLELESNLQHGFRLLLLCILMFGTVVYSSMLETRAPVRLGLRNTYTSVFSLDDSLADIKTIGDLFEYLGVVSERARLVQPLSSAYFVEKKGELKVLEGLDRFRGKRVLEVEGLEPRVDSPAWSLMAWVQLPKNGGSNILRKPLGKSQAERELSCWSWYVGNPSDRFDFGAHDFRGGSLASGLQESVVANASAAADGLLHNVALVVTPSNVTFYMDAQVQAVVEISRPVTDCSGLTLELGDTNIPTLGEVTFFARELGPLEMEEIMSAGYTLNAIAVGKRMFTPESTPFDVTTSKNEEAFTNAQDERLSASQNLAVEATLTRQTVSLAENPVADARESSIIVNDSSPCPPVPAFGNDTSCHMMSLSEADSVLDTLLNYQYFPLIKLEYMPPGKRLKDRVFIGGRKTNELLRYDPVAFPSWCGRSATFSMWVEFEQGSGYLLGRYGTAESAFGADKFWKLSTTSTGLAIVAPPRPYFLHENAYFPADLQKPLTKMKRGQLRHVAFTFNHVTDVTCMYLDGTELSCKQHATGTLGALDCGLNDPDTAYVSLNYRIPGAWQGLTTAQDWRYYREALSADHVRRLAFDSLDEDGNNLRTCAISSEGFDTDFVDMMGHDCAWYQETRKTTATICSAFEVQKKCPLACNTRARCYEGNQGSLILQPYSIWNKVMLLTEANPSQGKVCVREGVDPVAECRKIKADPSAAVTPPGAQAWDKKPGIGQENVDTNLDDCDILEQLMDPSCSFPAPWTKKINIEIKANLGYTIEFWWKALPGTKIWEGSDLAGNSMRRIVFFSKMSPPTVLASVEFSAVGHYVTMFGACFRDDYLNVESDILAPDGYPIFENGVWYRAAFQLGVRNEEGKISGSAIRNSGVGYDFAENLDWCRDETMDFIEGMQLPGGILISPIEITPAPLPIKSLQQRYYDNVPNFRVRRGPVVDDKIRTTDTIAYERNTYPYPVSLVSPPILLQTRAEKTGVCNNALGSSYQKKVWRDTTVGVTCKFPYECDEDLLNQSIALMSCSSEDTPTEFFGQTPIKLHGKLQFYEFLMSITDAPILVRNGTQYETSSFLDAQTTSITVAMVAFAPEYGLVSVIEITATMSADVEVDFDVKHFQSLEGDELNEYRAVSIFGFVLAAVILVEKVYTITTNDRDWHEDLPGFVLDVLVQVVLPVVYFGMRLMQVSASKDTISATVGTSGLAGVPWSSRDIPLGDKVELFFSGMEELETRMNNEQLMRNFFFVHATVALIRLIFQTAAHPRTAILINTLTEAAGDLWHFIILFCVLYFGFLVLGMSLFAQKREEFSTFPRAFETLWDMMLGSMLEGGEISSSRWIVDPLLAFYMILYNLIVFMMLLNFIIAIIVDNYAKVVELVQDFEAEQEFFTDLTSVVNVSFKAVWLRWPSKRDLMDQLSKSVVVNVRYGTLRILFPTWSRQGIRSFLHHYSRYEFMSATREKDNAISNELAETAQQIVTEVEERLAVLLGVPVPTAGERVLEGRRLSVIGQVERDKGRRILSGGRPLKMVGSTNVPRNTHSTILSAVGQGDGEAEINAQIQRRARTSLSSVPTSPMLLSSSPLPQLQTQSNGSNRSPHKAPVLISPAPTLIPRPSNGQQPVSPGPVPIRREAAQVYTIGGIAFGASDSVSEVQADDFDEPGDNSANETVTVNSTARAELQAAGIDMAFHDLLLASGLDLETLQMVADRDLYVASELEKAGILKAGDRIRILKALTRR